MRLAIIGAGMAGLACAEALAGDGHDIVLFDKGSRPGSRMATRALPTVDGPAAFDYGAQYMSARDPAFQARMARWHADGIVARWPAAGDAAWIGMPGMSAPLAAMAAGRRVFWKTRVVGLSRADGRWQLAIEASGDGVGANELTGFQAVVVAVPAEQVASLLVEHERSFAALADATRSQPCWTVMAAFAAAVPIAAGIVREAGTIGWAARNSAKPGRTGPEAWVVQASPEWSVAHLEDEREAVIAALLHALAERVGGPLPDVRAAAAHRWRYARSGAAGVGHLWSAEQGIGVCGDWLLGPKIEAAWLSGTRLAGAISGSR